MSTRINGRTMGWVLICLAVTGGLWCLYALLPQEQTNRLPDGSTLALRGWAYGKTHILMGRNGAWWQLYLPLKPLEDNATERECLVVWLSGSSTHPIPVNGNQRPEHWWDWVEVADEQGHRVVSTNPQQQPPYLILSNNNVQEDFSQSDDHRRSLTVHSFPRRGKKVILRFYAANRPHAVAVFTVPNPTSGPFPSVHAESLPCTVQEGDLKCTLEGFALPYQYFEIAAGGGFTGRIVPKEGVKLFPGETVGQRAIFRLEKDGEDTLDWIPSNVTLSDITGNNFEVRTHGFGPGNSFSYLAPYCTGEPEQMRFHFVRSLNAIIPSAEQWSLRALQLPKPGQVARSGGEYHEAGITFRMLGIAGPGNIRWEPSDRNTVLSNLYSVQARITPPDRGYSLFVKGTDDKGNPVRWSTPSAYLASAGWQECAEAGQGMTGRMITQFNLSANSRSYSDTEVPGTCIETFFFQRRPGMKSLRLAFAVNRSYDFTLNVLPPP